MKMDVLHGDNLEHVKKVQFAKAARVIAKIPVPRVIPFAAQMVCYTVAYLARTFYVQAGPKVNSARNINRVPMVLAYVPTAARKVNLFVEITRTLKKIASDPIRMDACSLQTNNLASRE